MKPILFNADMVRAILEDRKTVTRRVVKPQLEERTVPGEKGCYIYRSIPCGLDGMTNLAPYRPGDILYVRERWKCSPDSQLWNENEYRVVFPDGETVRFDFEHQERREKWKKYIDRPLNNWQSPYFMPREAARIFLRVTDVRVERLRDINNAGALAEGCDGRCESPQDGALSDCQKNYDFSVEKFQTVWDSTIKPADRAVYGWDANPYVWRVEFERCEKPKGA